MKELLKKKIDIKEMSRINGGDDFKSSGGKETGSTNGGSDGYDKIIDDNCCVSSYTECNY